MYGWIKLAQVTCVGLSVSLFTVRGLWILTRPAQPFWRCWLRFVPHAIDTLLLASGLTLAFVIQQYPFINSDWLTAKVIGLIAYIALGITAFRASLPRSARWLTRLMALSVFTYIVSVAVSKQRTDFLANGAAVY